MKKPTQNAIKVLLTSLMTFVVSLNVSHGGNSCVQVATDNVCSHVKNESECNARWQYTTIYTTKDTTKVTYGVMQQCEYQSAKTGSMDPHCDLVDRTFSSSSKYCASLPTITCPTGNVISSYDPSTGQFDTTGCCRAGETLNYDFTCCANKNFDTVNSICCTSGGPYNPDANKCCNIDETYNANSKQCVKLTTQPTTSLGTFGKNVQKTGTKIKNALGF